VTPQNPPQPDRSDLARELARVLTQATGERSQFAMRTAFEAAQIDGVGGMLLIRMPQRSRNRVEVAFHSGVVDLIGRWPDD